MGTGSCKELIALLLHCGVVAFLFASITTAYVQFEPVQVPTTAFEKSTILSSIKATFGRFIPEVFHKIARTTEDHNCILEGCQRVGEVLDIRRTNVSNFDRDTLGPADKNKTKIDFSHFPSGGVLLQEEAIGRWFMLYQFEKPNPGTVYRMRVQLENDTDIASRLTVPLNFAPLGGLWRPRVAINTPTNTMMGAEGSPPDGKLMEVAACMLDAKKNTCLSNWDRAGFLDIMEFMRYFGKSPSDLKEQGTLLLPPSEAIPGFKPYRYGFPYEVSLALNDDDRVIDDIAKLYALGRTGAHGIAVMQDGFTIYISGGKGTLFRFVADAGSKNYARGELYAAVIRLQKSSNFEEVKKNTEFSINWISLGITDADNVASFVGPESIIQFSDIFQHALPAAGVCMDNFELVRIGGVDECLRIVDSELAAVFEPERAAAVLGATVGVFEFSQIATKLDTDRFYVGVNEVIGGTVEAEDSKSASDVTIPANKCGCVFEILFDDDFIAQTMRAVACGVDVEDTEAVNECSTEGIANPRALTYVNAFKYLLIGEDSQYRENNFVWAWDPETERTTRIFHAAALGGVTSLTWSQDVVGGNNYIGITISRPVDTFGWLSYFGSFDLTVPKDMSFSSVSVPYAAGPKRLPISFRRATMGESENFGSFKELFKTGQEIRKTGTRSTKILLGEVVDKNNQPVKSYKDGPVKPAAEDKNEVQHRFGFTSIIDMCGNLFSIAAINSIPGVSYTVSLSESKNGKIQANSAVFNDWSEWGGLWQSGSGSVSPWNSHIGGEIHEPNSIDYIGFSCLTGFSSCFKSRSSSAFDRSIKFIRYHDTYFDDLNNKFSKLSDLFNPYHHGYAYEIDINKYGCSSTRKLMALGRFSHGDISIMPDGKTAYMTDYTTGREVGGGFFRFVADDKNDFSSGTLFAAKLAPVFGTLERFSMSWIKMGSASNSELVAKSKEIKFLDMFDYIPAARNCRLTFVSIKSNLECLDVKDGNPWAAFFETRRFAALKGASIEFANARGLVFDKNTNKLFMSINRISRRDRIMLVDDVEGSSNDIKVPAADCGVLYEMTVQESKDTEFDVKTFQTAYRGTGNFGVSEANKCNVEEPSNPSDLASIPGHGQLLVAEDSCSVSSLGGEVSCGHEHNALWAMDSFVPKGRKKQEREKTRILTAPSMSSVESMVWYPKLKDMSAITAALNQVYQEGSDSPVNQENPQAIFGFMGPFKSEGADQRRPEVRALKPKCNNEKPNKTSRFQCPVNKSFN